MSIYIGLLAIALAILLIIVGVRGTQDNVFKAVTGRLPTAKDQGSGTSSSYVSPSSAATSAAGYPNPLLAQSPVLAR